MLSKVVALGGDGEDWLALGVTQLAQEKLDKAEGTLKGAQNLLKENPLPSLHLAKLYNSKKEPEKEREAAERALNIEPNSVDAWAYLTNYYKNQLGEDGAIAKIQELASAPLHAKSAAAFVALQGFYGGEEATRDKAIGFARKGLERAPADPLVLLVLSALYGQSGKLDEIIKLLAPHEALMQRDVRLAHNYFEALFQSRDMQKVTALLNKAGHLAEQGREAVRHRALTRHLADAGAAAAGAGGRRGGRRSADQAVSHARR